MGYRVSPSWWVSDTVSRMEDTSFDPRTGEIIEAQKADPDKTVYIPGVKIQANVTNLARLNLTGMEFRVLFAMFCMVRPGEGNVAYTYVSDLAEGLDKSKQSIERLIHRLRDKGVITRDKNGIWLVNPKLGFRGNYWQWARVYMVGQGLDFETNSNGLDGKRQPAEYNRTQQAWNRDH